MTNDDVQVVEMDSLYDKHLADVRLYTEIINEQDIQIDEQLDHILIDVAINTLVAEGYKGEYEVSISIVDDEHIHRLNREHRGINRATDVLSFPQWDIVPKQSMDMPIHIGDIIISMDMAILQAKNYGHDIIREMAFLTVHSILHLLGYDHEADEQRVVMRAKEKEILKKLNITR